MRNPDVVVIGAELASERKAPAKKRAAPRKKAVAKKTAASVSE